MATCVVDTCVCESIGRRHVAMRGVHEYVCKCYM